MDATIAIGNSAEIGCTLKVPKVLPRFKRVQLKAKNVKGLSVPIGNVVKFHPDSIDVTGDNQKVAFLMDTFGPVGAGFTFDVVLNYSGDGGVDPTDHQLVSVTASNPIETKGGGV